MKYPYKSLIVSSVIGVLSLVPMRYYIEPTIDQSGLHKDEKLYSIAGVLDYEAVIVPSLVISTGDISSTATINTNVI